MPVYEFRCSECSDGFEEFLPMSKYDKYENSKCAKCKKGLICRLISGGSGFILSGSGWPGKGDV